jgi:hypothetical protein
MEVCVARGAPRFLAALFDERSAVFFLLFWGERHMTCLSITRQENMRGKGKKSEARQH